MPADFQIAAEYNVVVSRGWGRLSDDDLIAHQGQLAGNPQFQPDYNQLFNFMDVQDIAITPGGIHRFATLDPFGRTSRRAFVVLKSAMYGFALMAEIVLAKDPALRVQFDDIEKACGWLGIPGHLAETPPES